MTQKHRENTRIRHILLASMCLLMALVATACFRDASEVIEEPPVARELSSPTVPATESPAPTETVAPLEEIATERPPDNFALTATALIARLTAAAQPEDGAGLDDDDAVEEATATAVLEVRPTLVPLVRATVPPGEDCVHEVRAGETLFMLSLAYGSTVEAISIASDINNPDRISVGQRIIIPGCGTTGFAPPPTSAPSPTLDANAIEPTTDAEDAVELVEAGEDEELSALVQQAQETILSNAQAEQVVEFAAQTVDDATASRRYTVRQNDTLFEIAIRFGTSVAALAALNSISDIDAVEAGDVLLIP